MKGGREGSHDGETTMEGCDKARLKCDDGIVGENVERTEGRTRMGRWGRGDVSPGRPIVEGATLSA